MFKSFNLFNSEHRYSISFRNRRIIKKAFLKVINIEFLSLVTLLSSFVRSVVTNPSMNHQNQSHPVQLVAKFTAFPAMNSPSYSSRMVSASPATSSSIVGFSRRLLSRILSFLGCINFLEL